MARSQRASDFGVGAIQTYWRYEAVQMRERHVGQKTKWLILCWRMTQSSGVRTWPIMERRNTGLKRNAQLERHIDVCTEFMLLRLFQLTVEAKRGHRLCQKTHFRCFWNAVNALAAVRTAMPITLPVPGIIQAWKLSPSLKVSQLTSNGAIYRPQTRKGRQCQTK